MSEILIDGEAVSVDISKLDYNRFSEKRLVYEYNVIWSSKLYGAKI